MDYPQSLSVQVQAIVYYNEVDSLLATVAAMANAVRVYRSRTGKAFQLHFIYGDSSKTPVMDDKLIASIQEKYAQYLTFSYRVFGFNSGTSKGHNLMAQDYNGDYVVLMNPDVKVTPRFFLEMLEPFLMDEKVGMSEARQTPMEHQKVYNEETMETEWATGACVLVKKEAFDSIHGYDADSFFLYCDDVDFSWRLRLQGWKIRYQPQAPVYHAKKLSVNGQWQPTDAEVYYSALAQMLMAYKWSNPSRLKKLQRGFAVSEDARHRKALEEFARMEKENLLPKQLDPEHKVSRFVGNYFTENRYIV